MRSQRRDDRRGRAVHEVGAAASVRVNVHVSRRDVAAVRIHLHGVVRNRDPLTSPDGRDPPAAAHNRAVRHRAVGQDRRPVEEHARALASASRLRRIRHAQN
jgi:hypothetical protein